MSIFEILRTAMESLAANKLRTALTMLGVIIGVASVVTLLSLGAGVQNFVGGQLQTLGTNLVNVFPSDIPNARLTLRGCGRAGRPSRRSRGGARRAGCGRYR